ncbi:hypothetical protein MC1_02505 [Rickettsia parkeri str. Portsmouth]|nr:hypothetical protein MC1_02505 [Rickettsia parkeri str. Portsmouth]KJV94336.1 hypothetical protein RPAGB_1177 [Rickettsia parkeri str. Grand Bay]
MAETSITIIMIVKTSKKTSSYFDSATIHFQNATKAATDFTMYVLP